MTLRKTTVKLATFTRSRIGRYLLALIFLAVALAIRIVLDPWLGDVLSHPTIFTASLLATWYCGTSPAVLVAVIGFPAIEYSVLDVPFGGGKLSYLAPSLGLYSTLSTIIIVSVTRFRRERDQIKETERKLRESFVEQKRSQERIALLSKAIESAANSIVLTDQKGSIIWTNPAFTKLTGYRLEEVAGKNPRILKSGMQARDFYNSLWTTILSGEPWHGQLVNRRKDGSFYNEEMTITPVRMDGNGITHFVGIKENITERKQLEDALRAARVSAERAKQVAEEANQAKDQFLAVLSHELRTPLSPVLAAVQLLQRTPEIPNRVRQALEVIQRNIKLEARLIDDLLDLSRIASGKIVLEHKPLRVADMLERTVEICRPDFEARRLHFDIEIENAPMWVWGDDSRLQQVFWNILKNSIKFTPDDGFVSVRCRREEQNATIEIADTGIGVEPEDMARIFNAFEQGDKRRTRQFGGLGLGLAITKRLVDMHNGSVSAWSKGKNQGATFRVSLPLMADQKAAVEVETRAEEFRSAPPPLSNRILLVEDHGDSAKTLQALLESSGYLVETAGDVAQARAALRTKHFDLLISDLGLPDGSGLGLMEAIRQDGSILRGVALSGYGREEDVRRSNEVGFSAHLTKPVDFDALLQTVGRVLQKT